VDKKLTDRTVLLIRDAFLPLGTGSGSGMNFVSGFRNWIGINDLFDYKDLS
jgi:hypothetical protein